jgi:hypothetical protein
VILRKRTAKTLYVMEPRSERADSIKIVVASATADCHCASVKPYLVEAMKLSVLQKLSFGSGQVTESGTSRVIRDRWS